MFNLFELLWFGLVCFGYGYVICGVQEFTRKELEENEDEGV
jgi:hypothetical protein